jgi:hypothetical protein
MEGSGAGQAFVGATLSRTSDALDFGVIEIDHRK